jgi:hypothetical protein
MSYNFVVEKVLIWNYLESQNIILGSRILKFKNFKQSQIFTWSMRKLWLSILSIILQSIFLFKVV